MGINGVYISKPETFPDERGTVRKFATWRDVPFFGECYTTTVYKNVVKGWHGYISKTMNYAVPVGNIKLVLYDNRPESKTYRAFQEMFLGQDNYLIVSIPPMIMSAFMGLSEPLALAVVVADEVFDENKTIRMAHDAIPYDWSVKNR